MPAKPSGKKAPKSAASVPTDVEAFLAALEHPRLAEIRALCKLIRAADPSISEGIKWNAPSFRTTEYFATLHLRAKEGMQVILHLGAKKRDNSTQVAIPDPEGLLEWLATDRALARFSDLKAIKAKAPAFAELIRQWIKYV